MKVSFFIKPAVDETVSSWLIRLTRKHSLPITFLLENYGVDNALKTAIDVDPDIQNLKNFMEDGTELYFVRQILPAFKWEKGRSAWLTYPNRQGNSMLNSFSSICPVCLQNKGYFQLKWKFSLFYGCSECKNQLIKQCPHCNSHPSALKSEFRFKNEHIENPMYYCWFCGFDYRTIVSKSLTTDQIKEIESIHNAYIDIPVNRRYLYYKQFNTIEGFTSFYPVD